MICRIKFHRGVEFNFAIEDFWKNLNFFKKRLAFFKSIWYYKWARRSGGMADALDSGSSEVTLVWVQLPSSAWFIKTWVEKESQVDSFFALWNMWYTKWFISTKCPSEFHQKRQMIEHRVRIMAISILIEGAFFLFSEEKCYQK